MHHLENMQKEYPKIKRRFLFHPLQPLPRDFELTGIFKHDKIVKMMQMGEADADHVITAKLGIQGVVH